MRSFLFAASAALTLALPAPAPQGLDLDLISAVPTPENVTIPTDTTSQNITYDSVSAVSEVTDAILSSQPSVDLSDATSNTTSSTLRKRSACDAQPSGSGPVPSPDTASAFLSNSAFASAASAAPTPSGYDQTFSNLYASNNAYGYLGYTTLSAYDSELCASKCNAIDGCAAFNVYFERDPSVDPGTGCENPASTTNIKCVFWGGPVTSDNANNAGQWRDQFQVVIAGSNGYVNKTIAPASGYNSPTYFGNVAVDAPVDCNGESTALGSKIFTGGVFDARLCAAACDAQSATNVRVGNATCKFFNTYLLERNGVAVGQYCALYSQTWSSTYATYNGAQSGSDKYTVAYSYGFSNSADAGVCKPATTTYTTHSATVVPSSTSAAAPVQTTSADGFVDWRAFKANGANLGGWLEKEQTHDPIWWASLVNATEVNDEWTLCETLGSECGPALEARYESFLNTTTVDRLASVGVNTLRIPLTYAAFVKVPGSQLYSGNQLAHLKTITDYAINTYGMHIIVGLHSLPGGVNSLDIGEALMHSQWWFNATNLEYSYQAVEALLEFIVASGNLTSWTVAPINEASDNLAGFGTSAGLTANASSYIATYMQGVLDRIATVDSRIPMMVQDCFQGASFWVPYFKSTDNIVFDSHVYYFAAAG